MNKDKFGATLIEPIRVSIFNQIYSLRSHSDPEHVLRIARLVDERMRLVASHAPSHDVLKIAVLAALNIADELERLRELTSDEQQRSSDAASHAGDGEPGAAQQRAEQDYQEEGAQKPSWYEDLFEARTGKTDERLSSLISSKLQMQRQPNHDPISIETEDEGK
ncbi:MAG TPA: cell division protein ZapA [Pyrinomonadaceae bacterium]|nr:cell division protein ZapA [Pyrinomonadaceae bacterium]